MRTGRGTSVSAVGGALGIALFCASAPVSSAEPIKNIVLVHGAFVDGSGWRAVYDILVRDGYTVSVVQEPLTGLSDDVAATRRILERQDGPCVLVGHSYGGAIITEAGIDSHVAALVYIAAHAPDEGETETGNGAKYPAAGRDAIQKTSDGYAYLDPSRYHAEFAADLSADEAAFESRSQTLTAATVFTTPITNPAWKLKPSWYMVAQADRIISPDLERMYAARAHSHTVEVGGASHSVYRSRPQEVAALIEQAARHAALPLDPLSDARLRVKRQLHHGLPGHGHALTKTTFVQRVNTVGGIAPSTGCTLSTDAGKSALVPYKADYFFYRHAKE